MSDDPLKTSTNVVSDDSEQGEASISVSESQMSTQEPGADREGAGACDESDHNQDDLAMSDSEATGDDAELFETEPEDDQGEIRASAEVPDLTELLAAAIFASNEPCSEARLQQLFPREHTPSVSEITHALRELQSHWQGPGVELVEVATGWRFQVPTIFAPWIHKYREKKPAKYTRATLETLALIIYKQPITRGEIEQVRGVAVSTHMIKNLLDRQWIKVAGHRELPGRPALFATTKKFLDDFNLKQLSDMPPLSDVENLEAVEQKMQQKLQQELDFDSTQVSLQDTLAALEAEVKQDDHAEEMADQAGDCMAVGVAEEDVLPTTLKDEDEEFAQGVSNEPVLAENDSDDDR